MGGTEKGKKTSKGREIKEFVKKQLLLKPCTEVIFNYNCIN